jgi:hypothetical protein
MTATFAILAKSLTNPKPYEQGAPEVIGVTDTRDGLAGGTKVGGHALPYGVVPTPAIGACKADGKGFMLYGPHMVWELAQARGQDGLRADNRENYVEYRAFVHVCPTHC